MSERKNNVVRNLSDADATAAMGHAIAAVLRAGDVVLLEGTLGAGKTTMTRAIASAMGVRDGLVSSPTFVFVNVYPVEGERGGARGADAIARLVHVDAYRLTSAEDLEPLGWDRLFDPATKMAAADAAALVEWPGRIADALPEPSRCLRVLLEHTQDGRRMTVQVPDEWWERGVRDEGYGRTLAWFADREPTKCRVTGRWVSPTSDTYPFIDSRAQNADLFKWFSGQHSTNRPIEPEDHEEL